MNDIPYVIPDCATLKQLDKHYNTHPRSPLHHDQRCSCKKKQCAVKRIRGSGDNVQAVAVHVGFARR